MPLSADEAIKKAKAEMGFQKRDLKDLINLLFHTIDWRKATIKYEGSLNFVERYFYRIPWLLEYLYKTNRSETYQGLVIELHNLEQRSITAYDIINTRAVETIEMLKEALTTVDTDDLRTYYALSQVIRAQDEFAHILRRDSCIHRATTVEHVSKLLIDPEKVFADALAEFNTKSEQ